MKKYLGIGSIIILFWSCTGQSEGISPSRMNITESVYASVLIQPDSLYQAYAIVSGIIEEVIEEEGSEVEVNDPLLRIRNEAPELNLANARLVLKQAEADLYGANSALTDLKNQIATARLQRQDDSINYLRQKRLWEQNIGSKSDYERKKLAYELSSNRLNNLESGYTKYERDLELAVEQARINLKIAELNRGDYTVRSNVKGKVYAIEKEIGEKVSLQEPVAVLGSSENFVVELLVDERDIGRIRIGQQVLISLEAFEGEIFTASLSKIYPKKNERNQTFLVKADFNSEMPDILYAGLSGEANVLISQKKNVLAIPREYLGEKSMVRTSDGLVPVETGLRSMTLVEIVRGIDENTTIYLPND